MGVQLVLCTMAMLSTLIYSEDKRCDYKYTCRPKDDSDNFILSVMLIFFMDK